jgi:hypothetical protein
MRESKKSPTCEVSCVLYCEPQKKLRRAIQNKRRGMLTYGVLLHDNARQHAAARTQTLLEHSDWELFDHPPYSTDLAPPVHVPEEVVEITALQQ